MTRDPRAERGAAAAPASPGVAIVIVNWRRWRDTIECLESVFRCDYPNYQVIVCDNDSGDGSLEHLRAWAEGGLALTVSPRDPLAALTVPPVPKPLGVCTCGTPAELTGADGRDRQAGLVLVQTGANRGFAAGVNVGLRYALARSRFDYVWLLNNDTVIHPEALTHLVRRLQARPDAGMCGSTLRYYDDPGTIQALGGARYNRWLGGTWHIGLGLSATSPLAADRVERSLSYVLGASMLVSRAFLEDVGLMSEDYFVFFEELDWAIRGRGRYRLAYAPESIVYHKEGASIGSSSDPYRRSLTAEYFHVRNRLLLTRKFYPVALPTVYLGVAVSILKRIREGQWHKAGTIAAVALGLRRPAPIGP